MFTIKFNTKNVIQERLMKICIIMAARKRFVSFYHLFDSCLFTPPTSVEVRNNYIHILFLTCSGNTSFAPVLFERNSTLRVRFGSERWEMCVGEHTSPDFYVFVELHQFYATKEPSNWKCQMSNCGIGLCVGIPPPLPLSLIFLAKGHFPLETSCPNGQLPRKQLPCAFPWPRACARYNQLHWFSGSKIWPESYIQRFVQELESKDL